MSEAIREAIRAKALELGFDTVGFTRAVLPDAVRQGLSDYLAEGRQGSMNWLADHQDRRGDPHVLWPEAVTVIALAVNYGPNESDPLALLEEKERGYISVYARHRDYHDIVKKKLKELGGWMHREYGPALKVFVDTAPVMEKPLAAAAGLGWQGKHTNLVSRQFGSWLLLGEIMTPLDLPPDPTGQDHCGTCTQCLTLCPTGALDEPGKIDARRCISYLTIEHKGPIPHDLRPLMGNRIYGCDDCLAICPWNRFATPTPHALLTARDALIGPDLAMLSRLDDTEFRTLFAQSPVKRTGRARFLRNVLIAIGNSGQTGFLPEALRLLADPEPLIRGAAVWALGRLGGTATPPAEECDPDVLAEWASLGSALQPEGEIELLERR